MKHDDYSRHAVAPSGWSSRDPHRQIDSPCGDAVVPSCDVPHDATTMINALSQSRHAQSRAFSWSDLTGACGLNYKIIDVVSTCASVRLQMLYSLNMRKSMSLQKTRARCYIFRKLLLVQKFYALRESIATSSHNHRRSNDIIILDIHASLEGRSGPRSRPTASGPITQAC